MCKNLCICFGELKFRADVETHRVMEFCQQYKGILTASVTRCCFWQRLELFYKNEAFKYEKLPVSQTDSFSV